jgi:MFS family permease
MRERRSLLMLELGTLVSGVGNGITTVALPWLVLERTGNAAYAGVVAAATALPLVVVALVSGTVVDVVGRRRTAIVADLLSAVSVLAIPIVDSLGTPDITLLAMLAVLGAVFDPAGASAREAMLPEAAGRAGWTLDRANGVHETVYGLAFLVGPGLGGLLIATVGPSGALVGTGVAFVLAALTAVPLRTLPGAGRPARATRPEGLWRGTLEGLRFVAREPLLRPLALMIMLVVALYVPVEGVVLPVHFTEQESPERLGVVLMVMSAGMVLGTLSYEWLVRHLSRRVLLLGSLVGSSLALVAMALLPPFGFLLLASALAGLLWGPAQPLLNHAMQIRTPHHLRGRVLGTITSASMAAGPVGYLAVGFLVEAVGVQPAFLGLSVALLMAVLVMGALRAWRMLDDDPVPGSAAADHQHPQPGSAAADQQPSTPAA